MQLSDNEHDVTAEPRYILLVEILEKTAKIPYGAVNRPNILILVIPMKVKRN